MVLVRVLLAGQLPATGGTAAPLRDAVWRGSQRWRRRGGTPDMAMAAICDYSGGSACVDDERTDVAHYSTPLKECRVSSE